MTDPVALLRPGQRVKEVATRDVVYRDCVVVRLDAVGLVFEVHRTITDEGGDVERMRSHILVPWTTVIHVVVGEEQS
jgi:hypothetical protein